MKALRVSVKARDNMMNVIYNEMWIAHLEDYAQRRLGLGEKFKY